MSIINDTAKRIWKSRNLRTEGNAAYQNAIDALISEIRANPAMVEEAIQDAARLAITVVRSATRSTGHFPTGDKTVIPQTSTVSTIPPGLSAIKNGKAMRKSISLFINNNIMDFPVQYTNKSLEKVTFEEIKSVIKRLEGQQKTNANYIRWYTAIVKKGLRKRASMKSEVGSVLSQAEILRVSLPYRTFLDRQYRNMP